jgi:hypothetical protein
VKRRRGWSLVELLIAVTLVAMALAIPLQLVDTSNKSYLVGATAAELDTRARSAVDRIAGLLQTSSVAVIPQAGGGPGTWVSRVDFQEPDGWGAGGPIWGPPQRVELQLEPGEANDGLDDDGDGLVDEGRVVWTVDVGGAGERAHVVCGGVREAQPGEDPDNAVDDDGDGLVDEPGLAFVFDGDRVTVLLTLEARAPDGTRVSRTARRTVALRN